MRTAILRSLAVAAVLIALAACGTTATTAPPSGHVIHVNLFVPLASDAAVGSACDAAALGATGPKAATIPGSRLQFLSRVNETLATIGEEAVPLAGKVAEPIADDPDFPAACLFSFDVATTADAANYFFTLGSIYFPMPIIPRSQLEAAGWVANIGVNPQ
jgi:hypothetical protein